MQLKFMIFWRHINKPSIIATSRTSNFSTQALSLLKPVTEARKIIIDRFQFVKVFFGPVAESRYHQTDQKGGSLNARLMN